MFELDYMIFCEDVIVDANKRASLITTFDIVLADKYPATNNKFKVMFRLLPKVKSSKKVKVKITVLLTDGKNKTLVKAEGSESLLLSMNKAIASPVDLSGVTFESAGTYFVKLLVNGKELARRKLVVDVQ